MKNKTIENWEITKQNLNDKKVLRGLIEDIEYEFLGCLIIDIKLNPISFTNNKSIINNKYSRPNNYEEIEKNFNGVIIWGNESSQELFQKTISQKEEFRKELGKLIFLTMLVNQREKLIKFFRLLRSYDEKLFNSFGNDILKLVDLKTTGRWWDPLSW